MSENTVLEGLALRRAVYEAQDWRMVNVEGAEEPKYHLLMPGGRPYAPIYIEEGITNEQEAWEFILQQDYAHLKKYDTDLNTLKDAVAMLPDGVHLEVTFALIATARIYQIGEFASYNLLARVAHTEPATAAWNAVLRWKAREQEVGDESVK